MSETYNGIYLRDVKILPDAPKRNTYYLLKSGKVYHVDSNSEVSLVDTGNVFTFYNVINDKKYEINKNIKRTETETEDEYDCDCGEPTDVINLETVLDIRKCKVNLCLLSDKVYILSDSEIKFYDKCGEEIKCIEGGKECIGLTQYCKDEVKVLKYKYKSCDECILVNHRLVMDYDKQDFAAISLTTPVGPSEGKLLNPPGLYTGDITFTDIQFNYGSFKVENLGNNSSPQYNVVEIKESGLYRINGYVRYKIPNPGGILSNPNYVEVKLFVNDFLITGNGGASNVSATKLVKLKCKDKVTLSVVYYDSGLPSLAPLLDFASLDIELVKSL